MRVGGWEGVRVGGWRLEVGGYVDARRSCLGYM